MSKPNQSLTKPKLASVALGMGEVTTVVLTETQNYPLSACISDTGGAAGLFLGLHVLGTYFYTSKCTF